jgi:hypothetical protein
MNMIAGGRTTSDPGTLVDYSDNEEFEQGGGVFNRL